MLVEMTVPVISSMLLMAATRGFWPDWIWRTVFSKTTIASSTRKPMERVRLIRERLSRLNPANNMTRKVPKSVTGRTLAGTMVSDTRPRKRKMIMTTRKRAMTMVVCTSLIDSWIWSALS